MIAIMLLFCLLADFLGTALPARGAAAIVEPAAAAARLDEGRLIFSYAVRDGVTGNGHGVRVSLGPGSTAAFFSGRYDDDETLTAGPAHLTAVFRRGRVVDLEVTVGGRAQAAGRGDRDLGEVTPAAAAAWLFAVVRTAEGEVAEDAVLAAAIARDAAVAGPLVALARNRDLAVDVRGSALMWLAVLAGDRVLEPVRDLLADSDEDLELREHAIFSLSQLEPQRALPLLLEAAGPDGDPRLRRTAFFALAEFDDPQVVELFERILLEE